MGEYKEPTGKTKEKYDMFVLYYLENFNATQAAIKAGYSKKTARQQGCKLLTNVYIKEKIRAEQERLRDRMEDEGLRSFSRLLGIAIETEEKLQKHDESEREIERLNLEISKLDLKIARLSRQLAAAKRLADSIDGRKAKLKEKKRAFLAEVETLDFQIFELEMLIQEMQLEKRQHQYNYLIPREWERFQQLKKSIYQDILDRGGFKAIDKMEHTGQNGDPVTFKIEL